MLRPSSAKCQLGAATTTVAGLVAESAGEGRQTGGGAGAGSRDSGRQRELSNSDTLRRSTSLSIVGVAYQLQQLLQLLLLLLLELLLLLLLKLLLLLLLVLLLLL